MASLALSSHDNAEGVFILLRDFNSPEASWQVFANALHQAVVTFRQLKSGQKVLDEDYSGLTAVLLLYAAVLTSPMVRSVFLTDSSLDLLASCLQLLPLPLSLRLTAAVCSVLAACSEERSCAQTVWQQMDSGCCVYASKLQGAICGVILPQAGLQLALDREESIQKAYPLTGSFLKLLLTLLRHIDPYVLLTSRSLFPYLSFCVQDVFIKAATREYTQEEELYELQGLCVSVITTCVNFLLTDNPAMKDTCIHALVVELLSGSPLTNAVLNLHLLTLSSWPHSYPQIPLLSPPGQSSWQAYTIQLAAELIRTLLSFTSARIQSLDLVRAAPGQRILVQPLAQQLLANPVPTVRMLLRLGDGSHPSLQQTTLHILSQIASQVSSATLVSFFGSNPNEVRLMVDACALILRDAMTHEDDTNDQPALTLLETLLIQASTSSPSLTSLLLCLPAANEAVELVNDGLLDSIFSLLASPSMILCHTELAMKAVQLLHILCITPSEWSSWIQSMLITRESCVVLLSLLPYFLSCYNANSFDTQTGTVLLTEAHRQAFLHLLAASARLVSGLLFVFHRVGENKGLTFLLKAVTQYDQRVERYLQVRSDSGSPLLDTLVRIPQLMQGKPSLSPSLQACCVGLEEHRIIQGQDVICVKRSEIEEAARRYCEEHEIMDVVEFPRQTVNECDQVRNR